MTRPVPAELLAQQAGHDFAGEAGRVLGVYGRHRDVAHHDHVGSRFHAGNEWLQLAVHQLVDGFVHRGSAGVRVRIRVAVAWEVLERADDTRVVETLHRSGYELRGLVEVV